MSKWTPTVPADGSLDDWIGEALGAASTCWETLQGAGVFDSDRCKAIYDALKQRVDRELKETAELTRAQDGVAFEQMRLVQQTLIRQRGAGDLATLQRIQEIVWPTGLPERETANLGLASTRELLDELLTRFEFTTPYSRRAASILGMLEQLPNKDLDYRPAGQK